MGNTVSLATNRCTAVVYTRSCKATETDITLIASPVLSGSNQLCSHGLSIMASSIIQRINCMPCMQMFWTHQRNIHTIQIITAWLPITLQTACNDSPITLHTPAHSPHNNRDRDELHVCVCVHVSVCANQQCVLLHCRGLNFPNSSQRAVASNSCLSSHGPVVCTSIHARINNAITEILYVTYRL